MRGKGRVYLTDEGRVRGILMGKLMGEIGKIVQVTK
jgi:hypothetical protein